MPSSKPTHSSSKPADPSSEPTAFSPDTFVLPAAAEDIIAPSNWPSTDDHCGWMAMAIALAELGRYSTSPNPMVGCILVRDGKLLGAGYHQKAGFGHAEVNALAHAANNGENGQGGTAYVTLEPCSHHGRTGPCCDRLIDAGIKTVVFAGEDPNPQVSGRGLARLQAAGVTLVGPVLEEPADQLNRAFFHRMRTGKPWIRAKLAMSLDGRTAMSDGSSQWITSPAARSDVQRLRAESCAIVTGSQTIIQDQARLTVRDANFCSPLTKRIRQPLRIALDSTGKLSGDEPFFSAEGEKWWVSCSDSTANDSQNKTDTASVNNTAMCRLPADACGKPSLSALVKKLADAQCNLVLIESGATLAGAFLQQGLLDELVVYMAPTLLGSSARPLFSLPLDSMSQQKPLTIKEIRPVGQDWRIIAFPSEEPAKHS